MFNPNHICVDGKLLQTMLFDKYKHQGALKSLEVENFHSFVTLLDLVSNALTKKEGKDYYLHTKDGLTEGYCCAENSTGKPLYGTVFADTMLATLIAIKHTKDLALASREKELSFVYETYSSKETSQITPIEAIKQSGVTKFITASATLGGVQGQLDSLGFETHYLQTECQLDITDKKVSIYLKEKDPFELIQEVFEKTSLPDIIAITSKDASLLHSLEKKTQEYFEAYEVQKVLYDTKNPNVKAFEAQLQSLKEKIYANPLKKRLILVQGLAEGSNIFKISPYGEYDVALFKLEVGALDTITQTRYRVGARGRVEGTFYHAISLDYDRTSILTKNEFQELSMSQNKASLLQELQQKILQESHDESITYLHANTKTRRDFLKTAGKAAALVGAASMGISTDAKAWSISQLPPGIQLIEKVDPLLVSIYAEMTIEKGYNQYDSDDIYNILTGLRSGLTRNVHKTQPGFWFIWEYYDYIKNKTSSKGGKDIWKKIDTIEGTNMRNWSIGITKYFKKEYEPAKEYLAKTFVRACGRDENEWKELTNRIESQTNDQYIKNLKNSLKNATKQEKLEAGWSIFIYTLNEANRTNSKNKEYLFSRYKIEEPLYKNGITPEIRGPPLYKNI